MAQSIAQTLDGYRACLVANNAQIAARATLEQAPAVADEVEEQAAVFCGTLAIGGPIIPGDAVLARITGAVVAG